MSSLSVVYAGPVIATDWPCQYLPQTFSAGQCGRSRVLPVVLPSLPDELHQPTLTALLRCPAGDAVRGEELPCLFSRTHRFTFTPRLLDAAFDLRERPKKANHRRVVRGGSFKDSLQRKNCPLAGDPFDGALAAFSVLEP